MRRTRTRTKDPLDLDHLRKVKRLLKRALRGVEEVERALVKLSKQEDVNEDEVLHELRRKAQLHEVEHTCSRNNLQGKHCPACFEARLLEEVNE